MRVRGQQACRGMPQAVRQIRTAQARTRAATPHALQLCSAASSVAESIHSSTRHTHGTGARAVHSATVGATKQSTALLTRQRQPCPGGGTFTAGPAGTMSRKAPSRAMSSSHPVRPACGPLAGPRVDGMCYSFGLRVGTGPAGMGTAADDADRRRAARPQSAAGRPQTRDRHEKARTERPRPETCAQAGWGAPRARAGAQLRK